MKTFQVVLLTLNFITIWLASFTGGNTNEAMLTLNSTMPDFVSPASASEVTKLKELRVLMSTTYSGNHAIGPICTEASRLALQRIKAMPNTLDSYNIVLEVFDDKCEDSVAIKELVTRLRSSNDTTARLPIALLTDCRATSQLLGAALMKPFNFIGLSTYQLDIREHTQREQYNSFFGLSGRADYNYKGLSKFITKLGWKKVSLVSEIDSRDQGDVYLLGHLEQEAISLLSLTKIDWDSGEDAISANFEDLKFLDPRILILLTWSHSKLLCWLYRFNLFGPGYVIFIQIWSKADISHQQFTDNRCTSEMIAKVLPSVIYFGDGLISDVYNNITVDSSETSSDMIRKYLQGKIGKPELSPYWNYWPEACYDRVLALGFFLNATETLLNKKNDTLSNYLSSRNSVIEGAEFADLMKTAIHSTHFTGQNGIYRFDTVTGGGSRMPTSFWQVSVLDNLATSLKSIAFYEDSGKVNGTLTLRIENIIWRTQNQAPPRDSLLIVPIKQPPIPYLIATIFKVIGAIGIVLSVASLAISASPKYCQLFRVFVLNKQVERFAMLTNIVLLSHLFVIPTESLPSIGVDCSKACAMIGIGLSMILATFGAKLYRAERSVIVPSKVGKSSKNSLRLMARTGSNRFANVASVSNSVQLKNNTISNTTSHSSENKLDAADSQVEEGRKKRRLTCNPRKTAHRLASSGPAVKLCVVSTCICTILYSILVASSPLKTVLVNVALEEQDVDHGITYQSWKYDCGPPSGFTSNSAALGAASIICLFQTHIGSRSLYLAATVISKSKIDPSLKAYKYTVAGVYSTFGLLFAAMFIIIVGSTGSSSLLISIPSIVICLVVINMLAHMGPMLLNDNSPEMLAAALRISSSASNTTWRSRFQRSRSKNTTMQQTM